MILYFHAIELLVELYSAANGFEFVYPPIHENLFNKFLPMAMLLESSVSMSYTIKLLDPSSKIKGNF